MFHGEYLLVEDITTVLMIAIIIFLWEKKVTKWDGDDCPFIGFLPHFFHLEKAFFLF